MARNFSVLRKVVLLSGIIVLNPASYMTNQSNPRFQFGQQLEKMTKREIRLLVKKGLYESI